MNRETDYGYDRMGRRISVSNRAILATPLEQWSYTPDGLLANLADANGNATDYAYDGLDRLATASWPDASTETYTFDADGNVLSRKTRTGDMIAFSYDALNRPLGVNWSPAPAQATLTAAGVTFTYGYNGANQRIRQTASDQGWWLYPSHATAVSYTANSLNQYSAVGPVAPAYDGDGNLTSDGTFTYGYDAENRLVSVGQGGTAIAAYAYDAQGRRKSRSAGGTTTIYVTDAEDRVVLEYDGTSGALEAWYAYGLGPNEVLNQMNLAAGTRETLIPDVQGSIIGLLESGTGGLTRIGYEPFGEHPGLTPGGYRYTAQRLDPETSGSAAQPSGLYDYRARIYSPTLGRFLQPDPAGYQAGTNLYEYVGNDPVNLTGLFYNVSGHAGEGVGGSVDYFTGSSANGPVAGGGVTLGAAAGASVSGGVTNTWLYAPFGDGSTPANSSTPAPGPTSTQSPGSIVPTSTSPGSLTGSSPSGFSTSSSLPSK